MMYEVNHFINGARVRGQNSRTGNIYNPATGTVQGTVQFADDDEVDSAVAAARAAFDGWSQLPIVKRVSILFRFHDLLLEHHEELTELLVREHGKVWNDAAGEITRGFEVVEFACGIPQMLKGEFSEQVGEGIDTWSVRQPVGVVAGITPFNFPMMVPLWSVPIAVACGNTYVLKPSERDPSSGLRLAELFSEAGLPDGVFNVIHGDRRAVDRLLVHPEVDAITFVGSTPVATHIHRTGTANNKRVQALGGAKNHAVVMPDADLDQAVDALIGAAFGSAGERCMAISVAVAVGEIADVLVERIGSKAERLKIGEGMDRSNEMGPLITREHLERVTSYIDAGVEEGATLVVDGRGFRPEEGCENGFFLGATLFDHVTPEMKIYRDEIFGPVLVVVRVPTFEEAVRLINDNDYANGTAVFTRDGDAARTFANRIEVGMVGINVPLPVPLAFHSFGGWKKSLFGDHHMHGSEGVRFFTRLKTMTARWPTSIRDGVEMNFPTMEK
jgi:malonate-semialdehyde dehydrogenase (acetylating)/methylmalonate-semialdehyde dehydrogenase